MKTIKMMEKINSSFAGISGVHEGRGHTGYKNNYAGSSTKTISRSELH